MELPSKIIPSSGIRSPPRTRITSPTIISSAFTGSISSPFTRFAVSGRKAIKARIEARYVKAGIIDKPSGKKYSRDALAQLLMIVQLKLTTPMEVMRMLLHPEDESETKDLYTLFQQYQEQVISEYRSQDDAPRLMYALKSSALQWIMRLSEQ